ncbi:MAG: acyl carrier protein [Phycisphaerales bacterium]|nr:acyl carrier protein [Phycisphaerales bacterium]
MSQDEGTLARVKQVIRESIQLDADSEIPDDMALVGGEHDLDSLDMLLVVTSLEKEFGIRIASESLGPEVFTDVRTLSEFIDGVARG